MMMMYKSICVLSVILFMTLTQSVVGGYLAQLNFYDDNCTIPVGRFISGGADCPTSPEQNECIPVPDSPFFYRQDATTYCNDDDPPAAPEGWYSVYLFFGSGNSCASTKSLNLIQFGVIDTKIRMMADILGIGLKAWNVTGSCNNETGVITASACGFIGNSAFCPSGDFSSECAYNKPYQAYGYQRGCEGAPVPVAPPVSPPKAAPQSAPQSTQPNSALQNSSAKITNYMAIIAIMVTLLMQM